METIQNIETKITLQNPDITIIENTDQVIVNKEHKPIPTNADLLNALPALHQVLNFNILEPVLDKLFYYYFHFLANNDRSIKVHFRDAYYELAEAIKPYCAKVSLDPDMIKKTSTYTYTKMLVLKNKFAIMIANLPTVGTERLKTCREIGQLYSDFRTQHTSYHEQVTPLLSTIVEKLSIKLV